jgi:hypothetical protein
MGIFLWAWKEYNGPEEFKPPSTAFPNHKMVSFEFLVAAWATRKILKVIELIPFYGNKKHLNTIETTSHELAE